MRPLLRWLHLSDLHQGIRDDGSDEQRRLGTFLDDVRDLVARVGSVDLVLFTGDLTQHGMAGQFDDLDERVLGPLRRLLGDVTVLAVPGNHDLQRPPDLLERSFADALLTQSAMRAALWKGDAAALAFLDRRFGAYTAWWNRTRPAGVAAGYLPGDFTFTFERHGLKVGIAGLNTAALHLGDVSEGALHVHARQLREACALRGSVGAWQDAHDFTLLMTHHPPSWLDGGNRREAFEGGLQAAAFDLHLFGHMHEPVSAREMYGDGTDRQWTQAASLFGLEQYEVVENGVVRERRDRRFGYALVELGEADGKLVTRTWPRRAERGQGGRWRYGSDRSWDLPGDFLAAAPVPFNCAAPPGAGRGVAGGGARAVHADASKWVDAVAAHPAWGPGAELWKARAVAVVRACAAAWDVSVTAVGDDPWRDADLPVRVLDRLAEVAGPLRPAQVALLLAAPFVYEGVQAAALAWIASAHIEDFGQRSTDPAPRPALEEVHRAYAREARLVERAEKLEAGRGRTIALWMAHRAVDRVPVVWETAPHTPAVDGLHAAFKKGFGEKNADLLRDLARCLAPGLGRLEGERGLYGDERRLEGEDAEAGRLGALLAAAGALALDLRRADALVVDHVGTDATFDVPAFRDRVAETKWSAPTRERADVRVAAVECPNPVTHYLVVDLVQQARTTLAALRRDSRDWLPGGVSEAGVRPGGEGGEEKFRPVHVRFKLDHVRVRELLMGQQLYKDPTLAIRELYQNALDACRYRKVRTAFARLTNTNLKPYEGQITLRQGRRPDGRMVIECQDDGVGMDELTLERVFAVAGQRFHDQPAYLEEKARWEAWRRANPGNPIGETLQLWPNSQHGIGVLSYFMLADELEILTRLYTERGEQGEPIRVEISSASGLFRVTRGPEDLEVGTRVRLVLESDRYELDGEVRLVSVRGILRRLLVVAEVPVAASGDGVAQPWGATWRLRERGFIERWKPDVPRVPTGAAWSVWPADPPYLWWTDSAWTPVLVDGLVTSDMRAVALVNLRGPRQAKRVSADRESVLEADEGWVQSALAASLHKVGDWPMLTVAWLAHLAEAHPRALVEGWQKLLEQKPELQMDRGPLVLPRAKEAGRGSFTAPLRRVGFIPLDANLSIDGALGPLSALEAWRASRWKSASAAAAFPRAFSSLDPASPVTAALIGWPSLELDEHSDFFLDAGEKPTGASILPSAPREVLTLFSRTQVRRECARLEEVLGLLVGVKLRRPRRVSPEADAGPARIRAIHHALKQAPRQRRTHDIALQCVEEHPDDLFRAAWEAAVRSSGDPETGDLTRSLIKNLEAIHALVLDLHVDAGFDIEGACQAAWPPWEIDLINRLFGTGPDFAPPSRRPSARWCLKHVPDMPLDLLALAPRLGRELGPKAGTTALAALRSVRHPAERGTTDDLVAYLGYQPATHPSESATRWLLQACDHASRFGIDPARAVACAGRWWCWWLTEEERTELGAPLIPIVEAEAKWWAEFGEESEEERREADGE